MSDVKIYPEKSNNLIVRWLVEYTDSENEVIIESVESKTKAEDRQKELEELVDEDGGLIDGNKRDSISSHDSNEIGSNSTTDDVVTNTRQGVSRWFSYRRFYGEGEDDPLLRTTPIGGVGSLLNQEELEEVDKTAEPLGDLYKHSTSPSDFEEKAKQQGYDDDEIEKRQQKLFRKTTDQEIETGNTKIPLEEDEVNEDVIVNKTNQDIVKKNSKEFPLGYEIPFYSETKNKNPLVVRKLVYLINMIKKENIDSDDKAAIIYQFLKGIDVSDISPENKKYLNNTLNNG